MADQSSGRPGEFELIAEFFQGITAEDGVDLGIGDDAALIHPDPSGEHQLVVATDTLIEGVHFPAGAAAEQIASRVLAVNLSDMAAMGAEPRWFTLALTLPEVLATTDWLRGFSAGLSEIANQYHCALVGGDTTRGHLTISITLIGQVAHGKALQRCGAEVGDAIYVTGTMGDGAAALYLMTQGIDEQKGNKQSGAEDRVDRDRLLSRFYRPQPQILAGIQLREMASACIDVSDGLIADLSHICKASGVGAILHSHLVPVNPDLHDMAPDLWQEWVLTGGDDYQLCFTVPEGNKAQVEQLIADGNLEATCIGKIVDGDSVIVEDQTGEPMSFSKWGFDHFGR